MVVIVRIPNDELLDRRELALDAVGNWKRFQQDGNGWEFNQSRTHTIANEISGTTDESWKQPSHDEAGNMTGAPAPGDETNTTHQYVYDAWNRLVAVWVDSDDNESRAGDGSEDIATYQYDGLGRRIVRTDCTAATDVVYHDYYTPSWQLIEVRKGGKAYTDLHKQFVWGLRYIDAPILRDRETNAGSAGLDERLYYTQDGNFNVTALVNPAGDVVERYSYDAYGQVTVRNGAENVDPDTINDPATEWDPDADNASDVDNRLLYCGYRYDGETGLYHVRFRYLHPTFGRWTTPDPAGYVDGMGLYEYVNSSPLNGLDPMGLWRFWDWVWTGDGGATERLERAERNFARKARRAAADKRRQGDLESAKELDRIAESSRRSAESIQARVHGIAQDAFDRETWDRTNGVIRTVTLRQHDLADVVKGTRDPDTQMAIIFNEESLRESECFTACVLDNFVSTVIPLGVEFTPYQVAMGDKEPWLGLPVGGVGSPSAPKVLSGVFDGVDQWGVSEPGVADHFGWRKNPGSLYNRLNPREIKARNLVPGRQGPKHVSGQLTGAGATRLDRVATFASIGMYVYAIDKCRKKCFSCED